MGRENTEVNAGFIRSFKELRVWQNAMDLALEIFQLSKQFPADERFSLTDQIRRSSRSVAADIAEGWRKRRYPASFVSKLSDADAEAGETQTWLEFCRRFKYLDNGIVDSLDARYDEVLGQLVSMMSHPEKWAVKQKDSEVRG